MTNREEFEAAISAPPFDCDIDRLPDDAPRYGWPGSIEYEDICVDLAWCMWQGAAAQEREAFAAIVDKWSDPAHIKLHAGEMTAQELRTVQAVVSAIKAEIRTSM